MTEATKDLTRFDKPWTGYAQKASRAVPVNQWGAKKQKTVFYGFAYRVLEGRREEVKACREWGCYHLVEAEALKHAKQLVRELVTPVQPDKVEP